MCDLAVKLLIRAVSEVLLKEPHGVILGQHGNGPVRIQLPGC